MGPDGGAGLLGSVLSSVCLTIVPAAEDEESVQRSS